MATHTVSSEQLARDLHRILARARAGDEIHIEDGTEQPLVIQPLGTPVRRTASEALAILRERSRARGYISRMGEEFANDVQERIDRRRPLDDAKWD